MNYSDAERIATTLEKYKFKLAASIKAADLIIFVTCGVRQSSENRVYGQIHNLRKKCPQKKIILTGCLAHRNDVQQRLKGKIDLFITIKDFPKEIQSLALRNSKNHIQEKKRLNSDDNYNYLKTIPKYTSVYTAYVPIMTGCNNFCTYCVVPYARGREYSRPAEDIIKEIENLVKKGYKEIILLGQNVNSYHSKFQISNFKFQKLVQNSKFKIQNSDIINFAKLLKLIESISGHFWLTFLTSHPKDMSDELIETIAKSKKICEYVSLPAQSGDNKILRRMNRHYTIEHYKNLIKKILKAFERRKFDSHQMTRGGLLPAISTDIIVGFPGETNKQFENTVKFLREMKFDMVYISQYSPRPKTAAFKMKDNISKKEKVRREKILAEILKETALEKNEKYVGKIIEVLVDKKNLALNPYKYFAHTRTQKKVVFFSNKRIPVGSFIKIKITQAKAFGLEGKIL